MMGGTLKNMKGPQHNGHFIKRRSKVTPEAVVDEAKASFIHISSFILTDSNFYIVG